MATAEFVDTAVAEADDSAIAQLKDQFIPIRLTTAKFGNSKTLNEIQKAKAAEQFHASNKRISASRKLLDTSHPAYKATVAVINSARKYWLEVTNPYPIDGVRLLRKEDLEAFKTVFDKKKDRLAIEKANLDNYYAEMLEASERDLGDLWEPSLFPEKLSPYFGIDWDVVNVDPSEELKRMSPGIYKEMQKLADARFSSAAILAEQEMAKHFVELAESMAERLDGKTADGKPKKLHAATVDKLTDFFDKYQKMAVGSNGVLESAISQCKDVINGVKGSSAKAKTDSLKKDVHATQTVKEAMAKIAKEVGGLIVKTPDRKVSFE